MHDKGHNLVIQNVRACETLGTCTHTRTNSTSLALGVLLLAKERGKVSMKAASGDAKAGWSFGLFFDLPNGGDRPRNITEPVSHLDPLTRFDGELKVLRGFEHQDDRAPETETTHFLCRRQRLPVEQRGRGGVGGFGVRSRWRRTAADVRAKGLTGVGSRICQIGARTHDVELLTESKFTLMLPTFVAPTGTILKKPYRHRPRSATRSLSTNRFWSRLAIYGDTENSSPGLSVSYASMASRRNYAPTKCRRFSTTHAVGLWKRW